MSCVSDAGDGDGFRHGKGGRHWGWGHRHRHGQEVQETLDRFMSQWSNFYRSFVDGELTHQYNHHHHHQQYTSSSSHRGHGDGHPDSMRMGNVACAMLCTTIFLGVAGFVGYKFLERYVVVGNHQQQHHQQQQQQQNNRNHTSPNAFNGRHAIQRRSFTFRLRFWRMMGLKHLAITSYKSKVFLAEKHEDDEKIVYAYSIPMDLVPRIKVQWKETGSDPSSMDAKMVISIIALPFSLFSMFPRIGSFIFGGHFTETDVFGGSIPLIEIPMDKGAADPSDVTTFWETVQTPTPSNQDDRLLYIRIPKVCHRVTDLTITNGDPAEHAQ